MSEVISIEQILADGALVHAIAKATNLRAADVRAVLVRLSHLPAAQVWGLCEAARIEEQRQQERMRRKERR